MIDIVIPTMMKVPIDCFAYTLHQTITSEFINKIYIIDNSCGLFNKHINIDSTKIIVHTMKENIYVNPAWNLGVSFCDQDHILIMNDDLYVDKEVFRYVNNTISNDSIGICSAKTTNLKNLAQYIEQTSGFSQKLELKNTFNNNRHNMHGWFFCIKKKLWKDIPSNIKIFYGDTLIYARIRSLGFEAKNITNINIGHRLHGTIHPKFNNINNRQKIKKTDRTYYIKYRESFIQN